MVRLDGASVTIETGDVLTYWPRVPMTLGGESRLSHPVLLVFTDREGKLGKNAWALEALAFGCVVA